MASKNDIDITIGGKTITLSGVESEEYLREVASYLNGKLREFADDASYWRLPNDMRSVMMQLNLADDYFKEHARVVELEMQVQALEESRDRALGDVEEMQSAARDAAARISALEADVEGLRDQAQRAAAAENSASKRFGAEKSRAERLTEELEALRKSKSEADKAVERFRQELAVTRENQVKTLREREAAQQKTLTDTREKLSRQLKEAKAESAERGSSLEKAQKEIQVLRQRCESASANEAEAKKKLAALEKEFAGKLAANTEQYREQTQSARQELEKVQEELAILQEQENIRLQAAARVRGTMQELVQQYGRFGQSLEEAAEQMRTLE